MASLDVRDVLNLPQDGQGAGRGSGGNGVGDRRPSKKGKKVSSAGLMGSAAAAAGGSRQNLKGLAREVQSLGGSNPIAIVPQMTSNFKKKRAISRKPAAHWELRAFRNSARDDGSLVLRHWRRRTEAPPSSSVDQAGSAEAEQKQNQQQQQNKQEGEGSGDAASGGETTATAEEPIEDSAFAKFNVQVVVPQYNDDQYNANLQSTDWTREETDYLMLLVKDFDLRWPIIWDRYDYPSAGAADATTTAPAAEAAGSATGEHVASTALVRASGGAGAGSSAMSLCTSASASRTVEDLKARYYEIAAKMMAVQKPAQYMTQAEYNLHGMMANFKPLQEKMRKTFVSNALKRSREEVREEEALLLEVRRIMARVERTNEERRELYSRLDFPHAENDISTFKTSSGLHALLQSLMFNNEKSKKRKSLAAPDGNSPVPGSAGGAGSSLAGAAASASAAASAAGGGAAEAGGRRDSIAASGVGGHHGHGHHRRDSSGVQPGDGVAAAAAAATATGTGAGAGKNKKGGGVQAERRKLTDQERDVYGVSYHDRLGSGPTFRYEKINKLFSHKSGQQQLRITNILNELEMPVRLFMPTAAVTAQFEQLVASVVHLVDLRKAGDKLDGEIKIEEQRKAEREKSKPQPSQSAAAAAAAATGSVKSAHPSEGSGAAGGEADKKATVAAAAAGTEEAKRRKKKAAVKESEGDDADVAMKEEDEEDEEEEEDMAESTDDEVKDDKKPTSAAHTHTAQKRSASVLSAGSDKSTKRQKK